MPLKVMCVEKRIGTFLVSPEGSINSDTDRMLQDRLDELLEYSAKEIVLNMKAVDYMSSGGVRVILKTKKELTKRGGRFILMDIPPQIQKVFDIINILPGMKIFKNVKELDDYLDRIQHRIVEGED